MTALFGGSLKCLMLEAVAGSKLNLLLGNMNKAKRVATMKHRRKKKKFKAKAKAARTGA